jgi:hypothetical protein
MFNWTCSGYKLCVELDMQCFGGRASDQLFYGRASDQPFIGKASDQLFGGRENQINLLWKCIRSTFSLQNQHTVEPNSPNSVLVSALVIALVVTVLGALVGDSSIVHRQKFEKCSSCLSCSEIGLLLRSARGAREQHGARSYLPHQNPSSLSAQLKLF